MKYGYCGDEPSIQWKLEYANGYVGVGTHGKSNVMLIRTTTWTYPNWRDTDWKKLDIWLDEIGCDNALGYIPSSASFGVQLLEQYRWKPKDTRPYEGQIINYNAPCRTSQRRRKGLRLHLTYKLQGRGAIERDKFIDTCDMAESFLTELTEIVVRGDWVHRSCSRTRAINDWDTFATGARMSTGPPTMLPVWTQMSATVNNLSIPGNSVLTITEVRYFPDQDQNDVNIDSVGKTLATTAGVYNCPR